MIMHKIYSMGTKTIYQALVNKAERKNRSKEEVDEIIRWLTNYSQDEIDSRVDADIPYSQFFQEAPRLNPDRHLITGVVCGVRVEEIEEEMMQEIRYLDKLIDELAKGKAMDKILRS